MCLKLRATRARNLRKGIFIKPRCRKPGFGNGLSKFCRCPIFCSKHYFISLELYHYHFQMYGHKKRNSGILFNDIHTEIPAQEVFLRTHFMRKECTVYTVYVVSQETYFLLNIFLLRAYFCYYLIII